jgi:hypothetical protein
LESGEVASDCWVLQLALGAPATAAFAAAAAARGQRASVEGSWSRLQDMPSPRCGHVAAFVHAGPALGGPALGGLVARLGGCMLVFGGFDGALQVCSCSTTFLL